MNKCMYCSVPFQPTANSLGLYCSRSCAAKVNNSKRIKARKCARCGQQYSGKNRTYCSRECSSLVRRDSVESRLDLGADLSGSNGELLSSAKRILIGRAGNKCSQCGWGEINPKIGRPILTIDHIDGNWKNNVVDNLVVLCYNCHSLTPTFGALNKNGLFSERRVGNRMKPS